ncbi:MAG: hypothetical protein ACKO2V_10060 [Snowella sp.]
MRFATRILQLAALLAIVCSGGQAHAFRIHTLSTITTEGSTNTRFGYIETDTGIYTSIKVPIGPAVYRNLVAKNNNFYTTRGNSPSAELGVLDLAGNFSLIGSAAPNNIDEQIYGMTFGSDNNLYGYGFTNNSLGVINTSTGTYGSPVSSGVTVVNPQGGRLATFGNQMFGIFRTSPTTATDGQLRSITVNSPTSVTYNTIKTSILYRTMILAATSKGLYGLFANGTSGQQALYTINTTTGVPTFWKNITNKAGTPAGQQIGTFFHGAAIVPGPLPILATTVIFGSVRKMKKLSSRLSSLKQIA